MNLHEAFEDIWVKGLNRKIKIETGCVNADGTQAMFVVHMKYLEAVP